MTWVKLDDAFPEHPKVDALSDAAFRLHVTALCWCCRWLTDGFVPEDRVARLAPRYKPALLAELLAGARPMWERVDGGYQIHDFLEYQRPAEQVRAERAEAAERMRRRRSPARSAERSPEQPTERPGERAADVRQMFGDPVPVPVPRTPPPQPPAPDITRQACAVLADRALAMRRGDPIASPRKWKAKVAEEAYSEHSAAAQALLRADPTLTAQQLATRLEGSPPATVQPFRPPDWLDEPPADPEVVRAQLDQARAVVGR